MAIWIPRRLVFQELPSFRGEEKPVLANYARSREVKKGYQLKTWVECKKGGT